MADWSQSIFLQSLGWATINSFWQMGVLWCVYLLLNHFFRFTSHAKHQLSVAAIILGFGWFCFNIVFFENAAAGMLTNGLMPLSFPFLQVLLISASVTYLLLLVFPAYRLFNNWKYVQTIKKNGLQKAAVHYRVFVQKVSAQLNIRSKVAVFVSEIVSSPVTVGYLKPVILLPIAAMNQLTPAQVEAILLHELSHIRRLDYLMNFIINVIHTLLYFNPFVKLFMQQIDAERENCCDEMVLQFGYDRVAYCSALLSLEKSSNRHQSLALGIAGKKNLLTRIENIVGMEKKKKYSLARLIPVLAALICVFAINSVLIMNDASKTVQFDLTASTVINPLHFIDNGMTERKADVLPMPAFEKATNIAAVVKPAAKITSTPAVSVIAHHTEKVVQLLPPVVIEQYAPSHIVPVAFDEVEGSLSENEKQQVTSTINITKEVLTTLQWKQVELSMADALDAEEKEMVKEQYIKDFNAINWTNLEKNLKANYNQIDWSTLNNNLNSAKTAIEFEKLENTFTQLLNQLEKAECEIKKGSAASCSVLPDESIEALKAIKLEVEKNLKAIHALKNKKVIRL